MKRSSTTSFTKDAFDGPARRPRFASASFFIVTAKAEALDNKYSAFGKVESGLDVVDRIEAVAVNGETPVERVELRKVTVVKR